MGRSLFYLSDSFVMKPFSSFVALTVLTASSVTVAPAQNPISPQGVYIADPSARTAPDGRLYIYGSLDESPRYYCSKSYHVLSSGDLLSWTLHPYSFTNDEILYAPDLILRGGRYYLYYDTPDGSEYVAEGDNPAGPFGGGVRIEGPSQIDPNVFIDDNGQAYYFWGQFSAKGARMNPDMKTLDLSSLREGIVTEKEHFFHEGSFVIKRGEYYYFIFADISRRGRPTSLGYAMSRHPLGPYTYKGVIIDNYGCDPEVWNNHGSIVEFDGKWYVLYHRSTHGSRTMRKACIEPIEFAADGTIPEVEMTSQGAGGPLDAFSIIDAARACYLKGNVRITLTEEGSGREILSGIRRGDAAAWKYIDFGRSPSAPAAARLRVFSEDGGRVVLRTGTADGPEIGSVNVPPSPEWQTVSTPVRLPSGCHALWLVFYPEGEKPVSLEYMEFTGD